MDTQQLLDTLTDHMALYHCRKRQLERRTNVKGDRYRVIEWLKGLNMKQRQMAFTLVDAQWVALILKMQKCIQTDGAGYFFVLPDVPSSSTAAVVKSTACLPSLCFRRARGLLDRLTDHKVAEEFLINSLRLFSSLDGGISKRSSTLECLTLSYEVLGNVDEMIEVMDVISYGEFLQGQYFLGNSSWEETAWLKGMGYYSIAAFVVNKLEFCLWSAWITCLGTKQPSRSMSRTSARNVVELSSAASRICIKRQGFEEWWAKLDLSFRTKALNVIIAKASKLESLNIVTKKVFVQSKLLGVSANNDWSRASSRSLLGEEKFPNFRAGLEFLDKVTELKKGTMCLQENRIVQNVRTILLKVMIDSTEHELLDSEGTSQRSRKAKQPKQPKPAKSNKSKSKSQKQQHMAFKTCNNLEITIPAPLEITAEKHQENCLETGRKKKKKKKKKLEPKEKDECSKSEREIKQEGFCEEENCSCDTQTSSVESTGDHSATVSQKESTANLEQDILSPVCHNSGIIPEAEKPVAYVKKFMPTNVTVPVSHEWPGAPVMRFFGMDPCYQSTTTDRLNLDVSGEWQHPSVVYRNGFTRRQQNGTVGPALIPNSTLSQSASDSLGGDLPGKEIEADSTESGDSESYIVSDGEAERETSKVEHLSEGDYNQYFGGGVMYWTAADFAGMGYSRPDSLSSEDSSWARREADLTIVLDDIVGLPAVATPYPGLTSSTATMAGTSASSSVCPLSFGTTEIQNSGGAKICDSDHPHPILAPIVVRESALSRQAKNEAAKLHEARSPHLPRGRREFVRWKRSPSPVLRCVPPAPPPPPPSPVSGVKKRRGLASVRSGSSSPRHWDLVSISDCVTPDGIISNGWRGRYVSSNPTMHLAGVLLDDRLVAIPAQEHPDVAFPMLTSLLDKTNSRMEAVIALFHKEIELFCIRVATENAIRKPFVNSAVKKVTHALQVLWPRSRSKIFGSTATGLALPNSDVDLVVCLPPVRNLEPIKEAGILEGRNGIKETCLQHAARYLVDQDWVKTDSLKTVENTAIPIIMLVAKCDQQQQEDADQNILSADADHVTDKGPWGSKTDRHFVRLDISFESPSHRGLHTAQLVKELIAQFPAISFLAVVLKQFLMDRGLDRPYTGGLGSYCLVLLITRFLQHQYHLGRPTHNQDLGCLLMGFLHFFGCVFDPRRMCISIRGGGMYVSRDRLHGIDPLHIEDPLHPTNNVGRNCFRILQCTKAFADAYAIIEKELYEGTGDDCGLNLIQKILPSLSQG